MGLSVGRLSKPRPLPNSYSGAPQSLPHRPRYTARQEWGGGGTERGVVVGVWDVLVVRACAGQCRKMETSTFNSEQHNHLSPAFYLHAGWTFRSVVEVKQGFRVTINQSCSLFIVISHLSNQKFQLMLFQPRSNLKKKMGKKGV